MNFLQVLSFYHKKEETLQDMMAKVLNGALTSSGLPIIQKVANTDGALIVRINASVVASNAPVSDVLLLL